MTTAFRAVGFLVCLSGVGVFGQASASHAVPWAFAGAAQAYGGGNGGLTPPRIVLSAEKLVARHAGLHVGMARWAGRRGSTGCADDGECPSTLSVASDYSVDAALIATVRDSRLWSSAYLGFAGHWNRETTPGFTPYDSFDFRPAIECRLETRVVRSLGVFLDFGGEFPSLLARNPALFTLNSNGTAFFGLGISVSRR